ncbi:hypothetical protein L829_3101 [Mycobacteroides abscessus MAB_030201_1075]|uniref:Uncharacterized protein n=1 Tax=Mycobacteroides abscessus MAB_030201_1075 TaxID=1335410 RepID=A0A829PQI6_9MYCO|nr:hypothetical protein L829_3101 [Mycobacteroides abscessus MAB_030201_1075]ETZ94383.1 hypothetical protein L828_0229 [Mycobacteroides abscessus MAB_030201_1061]
MKDDKGLLPDGFFQFQGHRFDRQDAQFAPITGRERAARGLDE